LLNDLAGAVVVGAEVDDRPEWCLLITCRVRVYTVTVRKNLRAASSCVHRLS